MNTYVSLIIVSLIPVLLAGGIFLLDKYTKFNKIKPVFKQIIIGVIFGALAICGTEFGIPINGAQINARDAAVLIAGFIFGEYAGIIAGLIGGIERFFSVYWGVSSYTQIACSVSTILAGFYAALLKKFVLDKKRPDPLFALASGVVMEVFHLTMVFLTNLNDTYTAMEVVKNAAAPLILVNSISNFLATFFVAILAKDKIFKKLKDTEISRIIQNFLLLAVILAFYSTSFISYDYQNRLALAQGEQKLQLAISDLQEQVSSECDENMLAIASTVKNEYKDYSCDELLNFYSISELDVLNSSGIVIDSSVSSYKDFDLNSDSKGNEFFTQLKENKSCVSSLSTSFFDSTILRKYAGIEITDGYLLIGYDEEHYNNDLYYQLRIIASNLHIGNDGFYFISDSKNIIYSKDGLNLTISDLITNSEDTLFNLTVDDVIYYSYYQKSSGIYYFAFLSKDEVVQVRNITFIVTAFMQILVYAILYLVIYALIKLSVVQQIQKVNLTLNKISAGDLNELVDARRNLEFSHLSDDINITVDTLKKYIDEANKRIDQELEFARQIQLSSLPTVFNFNDDDPKFDIYALTQPAKEVGGDFYDFYYDKKGTFNIMIADVSGKGIPAAMFMMKAKTELKTLTESGYLLSDVFTNGNNALCDGNEANMFVTAFQGKINIQTGVMQFVNAGHNPPLVKRKETGKFEYLKGKCGFVLAGMKDFKYKLQELKLEKGDIVFLYTDGVTEATDEKLTLYGENRLLESLNSLSYTSMKELCAGVLNNVKQFVLKAEQSDDITMLAYEYYGDSIKPEIQFDKVKSDDIVKITEFTEKELEKLNVPLKITYQIDVAIDEIVSNIINHGYKGKEGYLKVIFDYRKDRNTIYLKFIDNAIPYNPLYSIDPDVTLNADERQIGGLGIYMVKKTMDDIKYKYENKQNILTITKVIK